MSKASSSSVVINFHPVDWTDYRSVVPWLIAAPFGAVTRDAIHVSLTVTLADGDDYTYSLTTEGVWVNYELPPPTARYRIEVDSFLAVTERLQASFEEGARLSLCGLVQVLLGRKYVGYYTCAGWVFCMVYGDIPVQDTYLNVSITTTELLYRLDMSSKLNLGVVRM